MPDRNQTHSSNRGFGSMDQDKQRDAASKGGRSVPGEERSFSKDHELAAEAGRKGGEHSHGGHIQRGQHQPDQQQGGQKRGGEHSHD